MIFEPDLPIALLDACVLYPYTLRDTLLRLAVANFYTPRWSTRIQNEWAINLINKNTRYTKEQIENTKSKMDAAFPTATVDERTILELIPQLNLPDVNDRHVLAAAIASGSEYIVTNNLRDFPKEDLKSHQVRALSPDQFIYQMIQEDRDLVLNVLERQSQAMKKWPKSVKEIILSLKKNGLETSANDLLSDWSKEKS